MTDFGRFLPLTTGRERPFELELSSSGDFSPISTIMRGRKRPILLKKSVLPDCPQLTAENAYFARRYAKSEPEILCSK
ncbi:hypothetical protein [Pseudomonas fluorescens]|uniref:hypothetical protein n=1 Tax=Pseudomonas fluorescens TaxID=294 RepID=UPI00178220C8|nr:hypothetical protein [Pseudomonas fluorescens]